MIPRCALCRRITLRGRRLFGGLMSARLCRDCIPVVCAIDVGGVVQVVEVEFSTAFQAMRSAA